MNQEATNEATVERFELDDWHGEVASRHRPENFKEEVLRLVDPGHAEETIHWGRNYLYSTRLETASGPLPVVVKQFRNQGTKAQLRRRFGGSKALKSWRMARAFEAAGIPTAEPVMVIESQDPEGPSFFVSRHLDSVMEARYLLRAVNADTVSTDYPEVDIDSFLKSTGQILRRMHDHHLFHRDLSIGNVLFRTERDSAEVGPGDLFIIDLNRCRQRVLGLFDRTRDLCRLAIFKPKHQRLFLTAYWGRTPSFRERLVYWLFHNGFLLKVEGKKKVRRRLRRLLDWFRPRRAHPHIPAAESGASKRDKIVWDHLSDQPHQHASKSEKALLRLLDIPAHLLFAGSFLAATPKILWRYRQLTTNLYREPVPWVGPGVCLRPYPPAPETLLEAVDDLGVDHFLLRLHPWEDDHRSEEELAKALVERGHSLAFSLPQNRDLVRDPGRWRAKVEELAERFAPYGKQFQVGQAINRSKWGIWRYGEYLNMATEAAEILRRHPGVEVLGPSVIDFEPHVTAAILNRPKTPHFDALASLLYVDRRGAPENTQLGFDTVGKVALFQAMAETSKHCGSRSWVTEVNWPLWEGPHSPAGKSVSVDETRHAEYLARYYLLALGSALVERVYWWQLIARGYGLATAEDDPTRIRRRPAYHALATFARELRSSNFLGPLQTPESEMRPYLYRFRWPEGRECVVGWTVDGPETVKFPRPIQRILEIDGKETPVSDPNQARISSSIRYFHL